MHALTIVCPVDYSDCSKRALRYAGALAEHFGARLVVLHVFDPMLVAASTVQQVDLLGPDGEDELRSFVEDQLPASVSNRRLVRVLTMGSPSMEILKTARSRTADLLVMGTHGFSGVRKLVYGSTLQAVLAGAPIPVLAVPLVDDRDAIQAPLISLAPDPGAGRLQPGIPGRGARCRRACPCPRPAIDIAARDRLTPTRLVGLAARRRRWRSHTTSEPECADEGAR